MKYALISPSESAFGGARIAEVSSEKFDVAAPMYWAQVADDVTADGHYWDSVNSRAIAAPNTAPVAPNAPVPTPTVQATAPRSFIKMFNATEQAAIFAAAGSNPMVLALIINLAAAGEIVFSDPELAQGMNLLVSLGLITHARSLEILPANVRSSGVTIL